MARGSRGLVGLGLVAIAAGALGFGGSVPAQAAGNSITFGTPTILDPIHAYGEPNVGINPVDGSVYDSGPQGTGVQRSGWEGSVDGGQTFRIVGQCPNSPSDTIDNQPCALALPPGSAASQIAPENAPGGGDAEQKFDSHGTQYFTDLYALACDRVAYTTNDGATAPESPQGCGATQPACAGTVTAPTPCPGEGSDRPWLAVLDPGLIGQSSIPNPAAPPTGLSTYKGPFPLVYEEYNNLNTIQNNCSDWMMIGNPGNPTTNLNYVPANNTENGNFGCDGYPSVDQWTGQLLEVSTCDTTTSSGATNFRLCLNIGTPDSSGFLHFLDDPGGPGLITVAQNLPADGALLFVVSSLDSGQNLHIAFGTQPSDASGKPANPGYWQIYTTVASAASGWKNWAAPVQVSRAPANVNIMPWIAAGDGPKCETSASARVACAGRSDTVWYGTSDNSEGPSSTSPGNQVWDVYMAQVVWPVNGKGQYTGGAPKSDQMVKVTPHPMQYGGICLLGTGCITAEGNRNVADFFEVNLDRNGAAVISYDDTSNKIIQFGAPTNAQAADHAGAAVITFARQTAGLGLLGTNVPTNPQYEPATPTTGMSDPTGDARYPVIGGNNVPGLDLTGSSLHLANGTLTATIHVSDLSNAAIQNAFTAIPGATFISYVTRWLMMSGGNPKMFYALAEITPATIAGGSPTVTFTTGATQSIDLCSVSACFPHAIFYPDAPSFDPYSPTTQTGGFTVPGTFNQATGTITINVPASDIGSPSSTSLLEETGTYSLASDHAQSAITNAQAQADNVPLEIDGVCCFNYQASTAKTGTTKGAMSSALLVVGGLLVPIGVLRRRRERRSRPKSTVVS